MLSGGCLPGLTQTSPTPIAASAVTPATSVDWLTYASDGLGFSIQYPQGWHVEEDAASGRVTFARSFEDLGMHGLPRGTGFSARVAATRQLGVQTPHEVLDYVLASLSQASSDLRLDEAQPLRIAGTQGALMTIEVKFEGQDGRLRGWLASAIANDYACIVAAAAPVEKWQEEEPILQAMLDSVRLSAPASMMPIPAPATPTPVTAGADSYEPDDTIGEASPITTDGLLQTHNLHTDEDIDYVSFEAQEGTTYTIETLDLGSDIDTVIYLYDSQENELVLSDDGAEELWASRIIWVALRSGTHYVLIRDLGQDSAGSAATYSIRVTAGRPIEGDRYEPDDTIAQASLIDTAGSPQKHTFHTTADVDYVCFTAREGFEYTLETGNLRGGCDTKIYLYERHAEDEDWLQYDDDGGEGCASRTLWSPDSSGTYCLKIKEYQGQAGPRVSYEIRVSHRETASN